MPKREGGKKDRERGIKKEKRNRVPVFESHCGAANLTIEKPQSS